MGVDDTRCVSLGFRFMFPVLGAGLFALVFVLIMMLLNSL
jgi:hypothetical protein